MESKRTRYMVILCVSFIGLGLTLPLVLATVSELTIRFGMPLENGGIFPLLSSLGVIVGTGVVGRLYDRFNSRLMLAGGALALGLPLALLTFAPTLPVALLATGLTGLGYGLFLMGPNIVSARLYPENPSRALNLLNVFYGVGAIIAPQLTTLGASLGAVRYGYLFSTGAMVLIAISLLLVAVDPPEDHDEHDEAGMPRRISLVAVLPFMVLLFFGTGTEASFGSWIVPQMELVAGATLAQAALAASLFWFGLTGGRIVATVITRWLRGDHLLIVGGIVITVGISVLLALASDRIPATVAAFLVGMGLGPFYPTTMAVMSRAFPKSFGRVSGMANAVGNIGPTVLPFVQGRFGGGVNGGMPLILVESLLLIGAAVVVARRGYEGNTEQEAEVTR